MTLAQTTRTSTRLDYIHHAVTKLSEAWMRPYPNRSGMRSTFRRWRPDLAQEPTHEMRDYIWAWMGSPEELSEDDAIEEASPYAMRTVDQAAALVALRAVAGDHSVSKPTTFGSALKTSELSDHRLMRLLTMPRTMRLEAIHRILRSLDHKRAGFSWKGREGRREVGRMIEYLYGTEEAAQRSANQWAADFFASRGKTETDAETKTQA